MNVPQSENRTGLYSLTIAAVLARDGLFYDDLVDILAFNVTSQEALAIVRRRRRNNVNETDQRAIASGKRYVARAYIDRAHRYGRIRFSTSTGTNHARTVWLYRAPRGGGPNGVQRRWEDERAAVTDQTAALLDRTVTQLG